MPLYEKHCDSNSTIVSFTLLGAGRHGNTPTTHDNNNHLYDGELSHWRGASKERQEQKKEQRIEQRITSRPT